MRAEQIEQGIAILRVQGEDAGTDKLPCLRGSNAEDLSRIQTLKIRLRIVTGDAGKAGDEQGQGERRGGQDRKHARGLPKSSLSDRECRGRDSNPHALTSTGS